MAKEPSPRADMLRAQREARYGHLQATAEPPKPPKKLIPYAGQERAGRPKMIGNKHSEKAPSQRKRVKRKRRTELPPERTDR